MKYQRLVNSITESVIKTLLEKKGKKEDETADDNDKSNNTDTKSPTFLSKEKKALKFLNNPLIDCAEVYRKAFPTAYKHGNKDTLRSDNNKCKNKAEDSNGNTRHFTMEQLTDLLSVEKELKRTL